MIRVVVVAPYASVRSGLRAMVERAEGLEAVGEVASVPQEGGAPFAPDVLLFDLLPEVEPPREAPLVALVEGPEDVRRLAGRPAPWAALPRDAEADEIVAAVRAVAAGLVAVAPVFWPVSPALSRGAEGEPLTAREREVLTLMADGLPNKTIAQRLGVSPHTVKFHAASLFAKLGAASRTEAVTLGLRGGHIAV